MLATLVALTCPQCGGTLPKQARWRMVSCPHCGSTVTRATNLVDAARFHDAHARAYAAFSSLPGQLRLNGQRYQLIAPLGTGSACDVHLALRLAPTFERVVIKRARDGAGAVKLQREATMLARLQTITIAGAAYFTQQLPQPVTAGLITDSPGYERFALVRRHRPGFWGSLADVHRNAPFGVAPHHLVWMWRRALATLAFVHDAGITHGDVALEHLLVHPRDHGGLLVDWSTAAPAATATAPGQLLAQPTPARDLVQLAWSMRLLANAPGSSAAPGIPDRLPVPIANLLAQCCDDARWVSLQGARGIDSLLQTASREALGPPRVMPFDPVAPDV